jgi:hypothetical protein
MKATSVRQMPPRAAFVWGLPGRVAVDLIRPADSALGLAAPYPGRR